MTAMPAGRRRAAAMDWLAKGPFAIAAAALQGSMNYAIVLYLTFAANLTATGEYRTLFSYYSLIALACMVESNKVFIKSVVAGDRDGTTAIFANKLVFGTGTLVVLSAVWGVGRLLGRHWLPDVLVVIAAISAVIYPFDLYISNLQAGRRFRRLFLVESVKYGSAFATFIGMVAGGWSVTSAVLAQLCVLGACNVAFFLLHSRGWVAFGTIPGRIVALIRAPAASQARTFSFANMLPASLENVDKLLVGHVFGLAFLGVYTLAYSTGRFVYNTLKPAMYVYYRRFVDAMPGWPLLRRVALIFTVLGAVNAAVFLVAIEYIPALAAFRAGRWATAILFLGYGIGILNAIYSQAFALNRDSIASQALVATVQSTGVSLVILAVALASPPATALILLALQYPVRDGLSVAFREQIARRAMRRAAATR